MRATILPSAMTLAAAALLLAAGCELPPFAALDDAPEDPEFIEDFELEGSAEMGEAIYGDRCASCHGDTGEGDGPAGVGMQPPPTDFTDIPLEPQRAYLVTREGGRAMRLSAGMPAFRAALTEQELHDVTAYTLEFYEEPEPQQQQQPDEPEPQPEAAGEQLEQ